MKNWYCYVLIIWMCISCQSNQNQPVSTAQHLHISLRYDPLTIDPRKNSDPVSCSLISMLYEGLTHLEPDGTVSLGLAESIDISKNHTKYTIRLKDALWSNGTPITAYDIAYSWKKILHPQFNSINAYFLYPILNAKAAKLGTLPIDEVGIYIEDAKTLTLKLEHPNAYFLKMLAFTTYFPVSKDYDDMSSDSPHQPLFSGPFILEKWNHNNDLLLKKNPLFWNASAVKLEEIHINIIPDEYTALQLYQLGQLDWLSNFNELTTPSDAQESYTIDCPGTALCFFNVHCFPFTNINIRKAFSYAIEKQSIVEHICQGREQPAYGIIPPMLKNQRQTKFIPDGSKELARHHFELGLKETGLSASEFPSLIFSVYTSFLEKTIALALQQQWKEVLGVSVSIEIVDLKIFLDKLYKRNYQFALMSILAQYFDPMNFLERFLSPDGAKNFCSWENAHFKHLVEISSETLSQEDRLSVLEQAESILMSEAPVAPIYYHTLTYLKGKHVKDIQLSPIGIVDFRYAYLQHSSTYYNN